ncbi:MAG TPA: hypothetical protein VFG97_01045, partial [Pedococcus sp.]|nr:hypothetical protein [Pedococcus sp.]
MIPRRPTRDGIEHERRWGMLRQLRAARPADTLLPALLAIVAVVLVALQVHSYTRLSPIDELQHIDSLYKAPAAPAPGDRVGQEAMRQQDCRGVDAPGFEPGPCRPLGSFDPATYQEKGYNTAA